MVKHRHSKLLCQQKSTKLGWKPSITFNKVLERTIDWCLFNEEWLNNVTSGDYQKYYQEQYK